MTDSARVDDGLSVPAVEAVTDPARADEVADLAAATFAMACPPHSRPEDIAAFIATSLTAERFAEHIADPESDVLVAGVGPSGPIVGYSLVHHREPTHPDVRAVVTARPVSELSKCYVLPDHHGGGPASVARALMQTTLERSRARGSVLVWLGVNQENVRAQRFYAKTGFVRAGVKTFSLNGSIEHDYILTQPV